MVVGLLRSSTLRFYWDGLSQDAIEKLTPEYSNTVSGVRKTIDCGLIEKPNPPVEFSPGPYPVLPHKETQTLRGLWITSYTPFQGLPGELLGRQSGLEIAMARE